MGTGGSDATAIHYDTAGEISLISEKTSIADNDLFLIEDSAASYAKKRVKKSNLTMAAYGQGARVYNNADLTISNNSTTVLTFNSERYDTDTIHDISTNTERLTCKTAGKYLVIAQIQFASHDGGVRQLYIYLNNTTFIAIANQNAVSITGLVTRLIATTVYDFAINDYIDCRVYQNSGGDLNITSAGNYSPEFMMQRIG